MTRNFALFVMLVSLLTVSTALSAGEGQKAKIGQAGPAFEDLIGVDDQKHSLADYADAKVVVLVFTCNHCPVAKKYEDRLVQFAKDYQDKGVQVVAINVNNLPADRLDKMKERAHDKGFNFPYLYDPSQQIAKEYGAKVTPHVFVLCQERKLAYKGRIDDSVRAERVSKHNLREAVDALLAGKKPPVATTDAVGCGIKYD